MNKPLQQFTDELEKRMWETIAPLEAECWLTDEPVSFGNRKSGDHKRLAIGERWGEKIFDCAWFRFQGTVPVDALDRSLAARIDVNGEMLIVDSEGNPVRGLTSGSSFFPRELGKPLKATYHLPKNETVDFWADAGFNNLFGDLNSDGSLAMAEIVVCHEELRDLFHDVSFLFDWMNSLPENDSRRARISRALEQAAQGVAEFSAEEAVAARQLLAPLLEPANPPGLTVTAIGHAHLDLAWLWPIRESYRKGARTFSTALYLMERYPDYVFGASQPQQFAWMKALYPELYKRIKIAVKAGRIELQGAAWVECDMNVTGGESIVRQLIHGQRFWKEEFDEEVDNLWLPDVFGYNGQLPQILAKSGIRYFMTQKLSWNQINRFPHHSFIWEGIDGSSVLAHMLPEETYNGPAAPRAMLKIQNEYAERAISDQTLMLFGIGDGGGGPGAEHLENIKRLGSMAHVASRSAADFFEVWKKDAGKFPHVKGELYLERHQGTFTTQAKTKLNNRKCEIALRELEWVSVLAETLCGTAYPADALDRIWKEVLLYQFHDILPGSSIPRVYRESNARCAGLLNELEELVQTRCTALAEGRAACFNSLPFARKEWVRQDGRWLQLEAPACGWGPLPETHPSLGIPHALEACGDRIENECLRVCFNRDGTIGSLFDKTSRREVAAGKTNRFAVYEDTGDAWDFPLDYRAKPPRRPVLESSTAFVDGPCAAMEQHYALGSSTIRQRIVLKTGSRLLEFETEVDWHEEQTMLRAEFPVAVAARESISEIQFGTIARPTHNDTGWDRAKEEIPAQQWVDLSDSGYGISLINDCKHGHRIKGSLVEINLLRCVPHPNGAWVAPDESRQEPSGEYTDTGKQSFRYALYPHAGNAAEAGTLRLARAFNIPLRINPGKTGGKPVEPQSFIQVDPPGIDLVGIKKSEDGTGWIARLCNMANSAVSAEFTATLPYRSASETNLMEQEETALEHDSSGTLLLEFAPFEIKTLKMLQAP